MLKVTNKPFIQTSHLFLWAHYFWINKY